MNRKKFIKNGLIGAAGLAALGSIQLLALGIIGEYLSQIFHETKSRPIYLIDEFNGVKMIYRHGICTERNIEQR